MRVGRQDAAERGAGLLDSLSVVSAAKGPEVMGADFTEYKFNKVYEEESVEGLSELMPDSSSKSDRCVYLCVSNATILSIKCCRYIDVLTSSSVPLPRCS